MSPFSSNLLRYQSTVTGYHTSSSTMRTSEIVPSRSTRRPNSKVKSGCRTCKIRKVKCDERFPVCNRCLSTGRICHGYGIWGGGGNDYMHRTSPNAKDLPCLPLISHISPLIASQQEKVSFDWFRHRTVVKLPGTYLSDFWTSLILQISHGEQAIWHAIMALSSTHRLGILGTGCGSDTNLEQTTLHHLVKATRNLRTRFSVSDKTSIRVVLIVCLVFVVLDLLRGHFVSAQGHLRSGLRILEGQSLSRERKWELSNTHPSSNPVDDVIIDAFFRLHTQFELFQHQHSPRLSLLSPPLYSSPRAILSPHHFASYKDVWRSLDLLLNEVFHLSARAHEHPTQTSELLGYQELVSQALHAWRESYTNSHSTFNLSPNPTVAGAEAKAHRILLSYHAMLTIMTATSIHPNNEMIFDNHDHHFKTIICLLSETYKLSTLDPDFPSSNSHQSAPGAHSPFTSSPRNTNKIGTCDMSHTITDIGWMIPLFYVATKCRDRLIRRQAIHLLGSTDHREGIWDAKITACIAGRVMEVEEGLLYGGAGMDDDAIIRSLFGEGCGDEHDDDGLSLLARLGAIIKKDLVLPESNRIRALEVRMEGNPLEKVLLFGGLGGMSGKVCVGKYSVREQRWI